MTLFLATPHEMEEYIAQQARTKRLSLNLSQKTLSIQSGVSLAVIKKFERTGKISLGSLLKLALVLNALHDFQELFKATPPEQAISLDKLLQEQTRQRGRR